MIGSGAIAIVLPHIGVRVLGGCLGACLLFGFLLFSTRYVIYFMAFWCMLLVRFL